MIFIRTVKSPGNECLDEIGECEAPFSIRIVALVVEHSRPQLKAVEMNQRSLIRKMSYFCRFKLIRV